jgi:predicted Ser/Thr protein kinase
MNRIRRQVLVLGLGVALTGGWLAQPAFAIKQFQDEFKSLYVQEGTPLAAEVERVKCNICHVGKDKKERNAYGKALDERLDKKADKDDKEKIRKMLEEVAALPSDPDKKDSPTFGDLIKSGKLPVATP